MTNQVLQSLANVGWTCRICWTLSSAQSMKIFWCDTGLGTRSLYKVLIGTVPRDISNDALRADSMSISKCFSNVSCSWNGIQRWSLDESKYSSDVLAKGNGGS